MPVLEKLLNLGSGRKLKFYQTQLQSIEAWKEEIALYTNEDITQRIQEIKQEIQTDDQNPADFLIEVFALAREASTRSLKMTPFPVQLIGGMAIFDGNIAEMQTGEGKTLTATLPAILRALSGKGVHVVTVNDYLAQRDATWMKPLYDFLDISVGILHSDMSHEDKVLAYQADITYGTNSEFGFDYLRDNLAWDKNGQVARRGYHFAIIDEIDNILIDEARTPLIISDLPNVSSKLYADFAKAAKQMKLGEKPEDYNPRISGSWEPDYDYEIDEKHKTVSITDQGVKTAEELLGFDNIYRADSAHLVNHLLQALKAQSLYKKDRDYAVIDNEVKIIDEFTGRIMEGRRWSDGLHQSVEAKEKVTVQDENITVASITYQNLFRKYEVLSGMTGTASTEANEFHKIYELDVVIVPPNRTKKRIDHEDLMFASKEYKWKAVVEEIQHLHQKGQPVLVGTVSVSDSEHLSQLLSKEGLKHTLLNAKPEYAAQEGSIVAQAGRIGSITIATNMAGRGVDIKLGGDYQGLAQEYLKKVPAKKRSQEELDQLQTELEEKCKKEVEIEAQQVRELGGLAIIGTERHESRRIDNQLRGRAGRQGDPGETRFYISAEDDLMRLFGGDMMKKTLLMMGSDDRPIRHRMLTKRIATAQKKVEEQRFLERKNVIDYDDVMNMQREAVYQWRHRIIEGDDLKESLLERINYAVKLIVEEYTAGEFSEDWDYLGLYQRLQDICPSIDLSFEELEQVDNPEDLVDVIFEALKLAHEEREKAITPQYMRQFERMLVLKVLDERWREHLTDMDYMQESIHLRGFAQVEPLVAYKNEASTLFEGFINEVWTQLTSVLFNLEFKVESEKEGILFSTHLQPDHKNPAVSEETKMNRADRRQKTKKRKNKKRK